MHPLVEGNTITTKLSFTQAVTWSGLLFLRDASIKQSEHMTLVMTKSSPLIYTEKSCDAGGATKREKSSPVIDAVGEKKWSCCLSLNVFMAPNSPESILRIK